MTFEIFPAIDLRRGRVVRLQRGDPTRETDFGDDPMAVARRWLDAGASWLHVVSLDGAFDEEGVANRAARNAIAALGARVQFGGGLRALADITAALEAGVERVVLGTAALEKPELVRAAITRFGAARVAVGIDARDGHVRTRGWLTETLQGPVDVALSAKAAGVRTIVFTDIARDGVFAGVNAAATASLAAATGLEVIASGGVRGLGDVETLAAEAAAAAPGRIGGLIIGRALYEGRVDLAQAIRKGRSVPAGSQSTR